VPPNDLHQGPCRDGPLSAKSAGHGAHNGHGGHYGSYPDFRRRFGAYGPANGGAVAGRQREPAPRCHNAVRPRLSHPAGPLALLRVLARPLRLALGSGHVAVCALHVAPRLLSARLEGQAPGEGAWLEGQHNQRQMRTGTLARVSTSVAWLPSKSLAIPRRPCEPITMRSQPASSAASSIPSAGKRSRTCAVLH